MTDELDVLRSFAPEAAGPTDDLVRTERSHFMALIEHDPRTTTAPRRKRLRRTRLGLALVCALVAVGGAAAGAGLIPDDVKDALGLVDELAPSPVSPDLDRAVKRGEATTPDGTVELWTAPTAGGGNCSYLRRLDANGVPGNPGAVGCISLDGRTGVAMGKSDARPGRADSLLRLDGPVDLQVQTEPNGRAVAFGKAAPPVARIVALDADGRAIASTDTADGWFVLSATGIATVEASDADGRVVVSIPLAKPEAPLGPGKVVSGASSGGGAPAGAEEAVTTASTPSTR